MRRDLQNAAVPEQDHSEPSGELGARCVQKGGNSLGIARSSRLERESGSGELLRILRSGARTKRRFLVVKYLEDGIELGDLQKTVDVLGQIQQF